MAKVLKKRKMEDRVPSLDFFEEKGQDKEAGGLSHPLVADAGTLVDGTDDGVA